MATNDRAFPLQFVVVGGSIGGLACAYALQKVGHQVVVLEQSDGEFKSKRGMRCPPNMTRPLCEWGLGPELEKVAVKASGISFLVGGTGEKIGLTVFHEHIMKNFRADFLFVQHGQIYSMLTSLAHSVGVEIRYNTTAVDVDPYCGVPPLVNGHCPFASSSSLPSTPSTSSPSHPHSPAHFDFDPSGRPAVYLDSGEVLTADIVLGTDGRDSLVRKTVVSSRDTEWIDDQNTWSINLSIPTEEMREDDDLRDLCESLDWSIWLGDGYGVYGCLTDKKSTYSLVIIWPETPNDKVASPSWYEEHPVENIDWDSRPLEVRLKKMIKLAKTFTYAEDSVREPIDSWIHENGRVVLAGDAAHPLLPTGSHHVAMAIEDAVTLSHLLSNVVFPSMIPLLLTAYEEIRQLRTQLVQVSEPRKRAFTSFPKGPEQEMRDHGLREAMLQAKLDWEDADANYLREEWKEYIELFNYDAREAVEDWWAKWGALVRRGMRYSSSNETSRTLSDTDMSESDVSFDYSEVKSPQVEVSVSSTSADGIDILQDLFL
ncbi:FAD/NAD(P)-binding domain-containing protein [Neolentinus lepideus HHB14362 ss-1]|uniref:FAD/NAD(P)-binding domain-containing protein n=1 Tax=Neolentinus lepideus HHB14362 ss-1 TaxID=1314782 RepID=A0A165SYJ3_9AGAM|nr:FAD/NAD(P)-binding domain-containing protein [Neolentinus lepideus HHB14362 ss-1]